MKELKIELINIDADKHNQCQEFKSTNGSLDEYLKTDACFRHLMCYENTKLIMLKEILVGYFTIEFKNVKNFDDEYGEVYPCVCLKFIVIAEKYEGKGIGTIILKHVVVESSKIAKFIGCRCLFIDALTEDEEWYLDRGFQTIDEDNIDNPKETIKMFMDFRDNLILGEYLKP